MTLKEAIIEKIKIAGIKEELHRSKVVTKSKYFYERKEMIARQEKEIDELLLNSGINPINLTNVLTINFPEA